MLIELVKFEFVKRWKVLRYVLLGYIVLQTMLLILSRGFLWNSNMAKIFMENDIASYDNSVSFMLVMILYFILAAFIGVFPLIESAYRFERDLSGKQSVLEFMIPIISWKKIVSKLATALCSAIVCAGLAAFSIIAFILASTNFDKSIVDEVLNFVRGIFQTPLSSSLALLYLIFYFVSFCMIIFCCIAISKAISQKNRIAIPMGLATFVIFVTVMSFINVQVQRVPIIDYTILGTTDSLSSLIVGILVFLGALFGTSWLMENRIEN
jgi:hypothetical protein